MNMEKRRNTYRRLLCIFIVLCMVMTVIPLTSGGADAATKVTYTWPLAKHSKLSGHWGLEEGHASPYHYGIDIPAAKGTPVLAAADGKVILAGLYTGYGYCVQIQHANGQISLYGHNSKLNVKKGQKVKRGDVVAYVGGTGEGGAIDYDNHCHFGIYKNKKAMNKELRGYPVADTISIDPELVLRNQYTATFKPGASGGVVKNMPSTVKVIQGEPLVFTSLKTPTRSGYTFAGWKNSADGKIYKKSLKLGGNRVFTAQWKKNASTSGSGKSLADQMKDYMEKTVESVLDNAEKAKEAGQSSGGAQGQTTGSAQGQTSGSTQSPTSGSTQSQTSGSTQGQTSGSTQGQTSGSTQGQTSGSTQGQTSGSSGGSTADKENTPAAGYGSDSEDVSRLVTAEEYNRLYRNNSSYKATPYYRYATRTLETKTDGYPASSEYTLKTEKKAYGSVEYSNWRAEEPKASVTNGPNYQTVVSVQKKTAYVSYAYFTDNKQKCWRAKNGGYYPNLLKIYSSVSVSSSGYKKDTDGSYFLPRTLSINSPGKLGTIYRFSYKGNYATSFTAGKNLGYIYVWPTSKRTAPVYKIVTERYQYTHYKWSEWSSWSQWTPEKKSESDTLKKDTQIMYYIERR